MDAEHKKNVIILDWRFDYEFQGGHIMGAHSITSPDEIYRQLFSSVDQIEGLMRKDSIIILHWEFSSHRAPCAYRLIRKIDREINESKMPMLCYPELYLLENGYKEFFENYPVREIFRFSQNPYLINMRLYDSLTFTMNPW